MPLRYVSATLSMVLVAVLAACASASGIAANVAATTLPSGWRVDCTEDKFKAERTCFAGAFGSGQRGDFAFFQIAYVNGKGPNLVVPNDFPGKTPTVRVDNGAVLTDPGEIVSALESGEKAFVVFYVWPKGEDRMTVSLTGFSEAFAKLKSLI